MNMWNTGEWIIATNPITAALWQSLGWLVTWMLSCIEQSSSSDVSKEPFESEHFQLKGDLSLPLPPYPSLLYSEFMIFTMWWIEYWMWLTSFTAPLWWKRTVCYRPRFCLLIFLCLHKASAIHSVLCFDTWPVLFVAEQNWIVAFWLAVTASASTSLNPSLCNRYKIMPDESNNQLT